MTVPSSEASSPRPIAVIASSRASWAPSGAPRFWTVPFEGGVEEPMALPRAYQGKISPDGSRLAGNFTDGYSGMCPAAEGYQDYVSAWVIDRYLLPHLNPENFEQVAIPAAVIGEQARFLLPQMRLAVEFIEGQPASVLFPDIIDVRIADTAPPVHQQQDSTLKAAKLENGVQIMVPQFIKTGDAIRLDLVNLRYVDRAKTMAKG